MEVREHEIYKFLAQHKSSARIADVCDALGKDKEMRNKIREKILMMSRYGIIFRDGDYVATRKSVLEDAKQSISKRRRWKVQVRHVEPAATEIMQK